MKANKLLIAVLSMTAAVLGGVLIMLLGRVSAAAWLENCGIFIGSGSLCALLITSFVLLIKYLSKKNRLLVSTIFIVAAICGSGLILLNEDASLTGFLPSLGLFLFEFSFISMVVLLIVWSVRASKEKANPETQKAESPVKAKAEDIFIVCAALGLSVLTLWLGSRYLNDLEHYRRVYDHPAYVTAVVSDHDSYTRSNGSSSSTKRYRSYISYTVNDVTYSDIRYEDKNSEEKLTPIGTAVRLSVSPEDPSKLISALKDSGTDILYSIPLLLFSVFSLIYYILNSKRLVLSEVPPEPEVIKADIISSVKHRSWRPGFFFGCLAYIAVYLRYPMIIKSWVLWIAAASAVCWLWCLKNAIRDIYHAKKGNVRLSHAVLASKGSPGKKKYTTLFFRSADGTSWHTDVTAAKYAAARVGDVVLAVYLPGGKKPVIYYHLPDYRKNKTQAAGNSERHNAKHSSGSGKQKR